MDAIEVRATLETRVSKKSGKTYQCIVIMLTDTYEKIVFLDNAEVELIKMNY
jgi:hypothetical protein